MERQGTDTLPGLVSNHRYIRMTSNAVPASVTSPSPDEWPEMVKTVSGITNARQAVAHCVGHGYTSADEGITTVMFKQVVGMLPINGLPGTIQSIVDVDHFSVNINSTQFPIYRSGGVVITLTGNPPVSRQGSQWGNTPWRNTATTN